MDAYNQDAWWNRPTTPAQTEPAAATPAAQPSPQKQEDPHAEFRRIAREEHVTATQQYQAYAEQRRTDYAKATEAFLKNPDLAPYFEMAKDHFTMLDNATQGQTPVAQLFDLTVRQMESYRSKGLLPPKKSMPRGGFINPSQNYDIPDLDGNFTNQPKFRSENAEEKLARNHDYILRRRVDLELRKDRSTPEDEIINNRVSSLSSNTITRASN